MKDMQGEEIKVGSLVLCSDIAIPTNLLNNVFKVVDIDLLNLIELHTLNKQCPRRFYVYSSLLQVIL